MSCSRLQVCFPGIISAGNVSTANYKGLGMCESLIESSLSRAIHPDQKVLGPKAALAAPLHRYIISSDNANDLAMSQVL